ncbi:MAG: DUF1080 domain-containing protein [Planctomycetes bacterium]|nr:DUF1080 domain-containing protein [Planctomycetota bacterium]
MKRGFLIAALAFFTMPAVRAQEVSEAEKKEGFVSIFNGKDFTGWHFGAEAALPVKLPSNWKVKDGVIKLAGGSSPHLGSQWDYEDFELRLQWRALREKYNSGLYVRSSRSVGTNQINLAHGAEGGLIGNQGARGAKIVPKLQKPATQWNDWRVRAVGDKVTFWCNGELAWEATNFKPLRGYIGLQAEGAPMEFRNLRIREIGFQALPAKDWDLDKDGVWQVKGDVLVTNGKGRSRAWARKDYTNCVLRLECRAPKGADGGVLLRGKELTTRVRSILPIGHEKQLPDAWNYLEVRLAGGKATAWLNGTVVTDNFNVKGNLGSSAARIGLGAVGPMAFRNVRIRDLGE